MVDWIKQRSGKRYGKRKNIYLKDMKQGWYQTEDRLLPILSCTVEVADKTSGMETTQYMEIINLTGEPGIPDKWENLGAVWPDEPPGEYPILDSHVIY